MHSLADIAGKEGRLLNSWDGTCGVGGRLSFGTGRLIMNMKVFWERGWERGGGKGLTIERLKMWWFGVVMRCGLLDV